jgi:polysaccharide biosynthesis transport protein
MTTQNLLTLIERYNLYPEVRLNKPREILLQRMREDISMKMISADVIDPRSGRPTQATIAFSVNYKNHSPELALKVANELTSLYLNENLNSRTQLAQRTTSFFGEEAARQQTKILDLDKKLSEFKQKHQEELPDLNQINHQISERTEMDVRDAENRIAALDSQQVLLQAQLAQISPTSVIMSDSGQRMLSTQDRLKSLKSELAGYRARYAPGHPDIVNTEREVQGLEQQTQADDDTSDLLRRLQAAKDELARDQQKYAPEHPDIQRLNREISALEREVAATPATKTLSQSRTHADNPAYIQVQGQLDAVLVERSSAVQKRDELKAKLEQYERRLLLAPAVEREYRELARDLDSAQLKYQELRSKQSEVQVSQNLEAEQKGERFTMIEPPLPPEKPISPNRTLILVMGFVFSLTAALGAVAVRNNLDLSVRGPQDIRSLLSVAPLAVIPQIVTPADRQLRRRRSWYSWVGAIVGSVALITGVHLFVRPLDVLWIGLLRRFGA